MEGGKDVVTEDGTQSEEEITMAEFLQEQEKLEKDANVVLGGSDHSNCTYALVCNLKLTSIFGLDKYCYIIPVKNSAMNVNEVCHCT